MGKTSLWSRVGDWLKTSSRPVEEHDVERTNEPVQAHSFPESNTPVVDDGRPPALRRGLIRREPSSRERLEEGFAKVVDLVESIQEHFKVQDERGVRMVESLDRMAENLTHAPETSKRQAELLSEIRAQLEAEAAGAKRLEETLAELPHIADAQRESMVSIGRQLDMMRGVTERSATAFSELQGGVAQLGEATNASTTALKHMHVDSAAREDRMVELLEGQTKKLTLFAAAAIVLAALAAVVGVVALLR